MANVPHEGWEEFTQFISRTWIWCASILIGVVAKISTELLMNRRLNFLQWIGIVGVSVFFGYLSAVWCDHKGWVDQGKYVVPISTLMGEKITIYLAANYRKIGDAILSIFTKKQ